MQILSPGSVPKTPGVQHLAPYAINTAHGPYIGTAKAGLTTPVYPAQPPVTGTLGMGALGGANSGTGPYIGTLTTLTPAATRTGAAVKQPTGGSNSNGSSATTNNTGGSGGDNANSIYNLDTDPVVQKIKALNANNNAQAVAGAQATAKQDLIGAGFNLGDILAAHPELGAGILGSVLADQATNEAAQQNPYSTAAQLSQVHNQNVHTIDQNDNAANLYYSSTRANQLGNEAHQYLGGVASEQDKVAQALAALIGGVAAEGQKENQNLATAYDTARQNEVVNAINSGEVLAGYDQNGNPIFTTPPGSSSTSAGSSTDGGASSGASAGTSTAPKTPTASTLAAALAPVARRATANKTGASARKNGGVFSVH